METETQNQERIFDKAHGGLESLAAAASRRSENNGTEEDLESKDEKSEKQREPTKAQKGKVRKAYTITKQRERWTDGEHDRFLQALKRYGRAWRKIEEHIGTKTAVQIRSHAQKFFSKLQREQSMSGGLGEESSKAGISIPPPRPKRKPSHPYPRKYNGSSELDQSADVETERERALSAPNQPSSTPCLLDPTAQRAITGGAVNADMSLSQILESAAAAAAFAWSQVVSNAAPQVQQQLQAQVAAHQTAQSLQPFFGMQQLQPNTAVLQGLASKMQPVNSIQEAMAKNLASSSHHLSNQFLPPCSQGRSMYSSASPASLRHISSDRDSPENGGTVAAAGIEKDCASSREHSRDFSVPATRPRTVSPYQGPPNYWSGVAAPSSEQRLGRAALNLMARSQVQHPVAMPAQLQRTVPEISPCRVPSTGGQHGQAAVRLEKPKPAKAGTPDNVKSNHSSQACSDISQLAHYYQQAAAQEQQAAENAENGSSAGAEAGSGSGGSSADGEKRSDKGSANNNTSGSDEDGSGQGNGSDGTTATADLYPKGSDDGSNSPTDIAQLSPKKEPEEDKPAPQPSGSATPKLFSIGTDPTGLTSASTQWQQLQHPSMATQTSVDSQPHQALSQAVSPHQIAAYQQQALQAWAATAQQTLPNYQLLQSMLSSMQVQRVSGPTSEAINVMATPPGAKSGQLEHRASDVPSMDTFNASTRSCSVPPFSFSEGKRPSSLLSNSHLNGEEQSGFKPYSKKHGIPISSLPPSKRFAAATSVDRPVPHKAPRLYTPFGSLNAQGQTRSLVS